MMMHEWQTIYEHRRYLQDLPAIYYSVQPPKAESDKCRRNTQICLSGFLIDTSIKVARYLDTGPYYNINQLIYMCSSSLHLHVNRIFKCMFEFKRGSTIKL